MAKFRYYIVSVGNGDVKGTDDKEVVDEMRESQDDFVIDSETGKWLVSEEMLEGGEIEIEEQKKYEPKEQEEKIGNNPEEELGGHPHDD